MAELLLLLVSENKGLPYWNSTPSLQSDNIHHLGMMPIIIQLNFVDMCQFKSKIQHDIGCHLGFVIQCYQTTHETA